MPRPLGRVADKYWFADEAGVIANELKLPIYATEGTAEMLGDVGIRCIRVEKTEGGKNSAISLIVDKKVDLVINVPREFDELGRPDGLSDSPPSHRCWRAAHHRSATSSCRNRSAQMEDSIGSRARELE